MTVLSFLGLCLMVLSFAVYSNIVTRQKNMHPKSLTDDERQQQITQWTFLVGLGALIYIIGLFI